MPLSTSLERGSGLVDAILAAGLLATALTTLVALAALATGANAASDDLTRAALFAQHRLEQLRAPAGPPPPADGVVHTEHLDGSGVAVPSAEAAVFVRRWQANPLAVAPPGATLFRVEVTRRLAVRQPVAVTVVAIRGLEP